MGYTGETRRGILKWLTMRIKQWNTGRGKDATREAVESAEAEGIDVVLIQEPYQMQGVIKQRTGRWLYCAINNEVWSAVVVIRKEVLAILQRDKSNEYVVSVALSWEGEQIVVVSAYCRFSMEIGDMLNRMERILIGAGGRGVIIGADVNARSTLWAEEAADERVEQVEEMVLRHDLMILNREGEMRTFEDYGGRSRNLDITMVSRDLSGREWSWSVKEECLSDHCSIEICMGKRQVVQRRKNDLSSGQLNWRNADWPKLKRVVRRELLEEDMEGRNVNEVAARLQMVVKKACEESVEKGTTSKMVVPRVGGHEA